MNKSPNRRETSGGPGMPPGVFRRIAPGQSGTSLLEIIATLAVFSVGMLGIIQTYHFGLDKIRSLRESSIARQAVSNEMETVRALAFADLAEGERAPFRSVPLDLDQLANATPEVSIRPYGDGALRVKEVTVLLRWTGDNGRIQRASLTTLIAATEGASS